VLVFFFMKVLKHLVHTKPFAFDIQFWWVLWELQHVLNKLVSHWWKLNHPCIIKYMWMKQCKITIIVVER
jgi:hypothetical protein